MLNVENRLEQDTNVTPQKIEQHLVIGAVDLVGQSLVKVQ
jgi:hypothetical protein